MKRVGWVIKIKPEKLEEYKMLHANPWEGVVKQIKACNIENYSIFYGGDYLFSYLEYVGDNFESDMAKMGEDPLTQEWWKKTDPCQEVVPWAKQGDKWTDLEEVFHLD